MTAALATAADPAEFTGLVGWVVDVVASGGPIGIALLLALDNVLPIVPSEVVLPFAGYLTSTGDLSFWVVLGAATIGSTASAFVYYELGRRMGHDRARRLLTRLPLTEDDDLDRAGEWFTRHGTVSVLTGRFVPFVRSVISLPAGTEGMGRLRFGVLTAVGSGIWNAVWLWIGALVGERWTSAGQYSDWMNLAAAVVAVALLARYVWHRRARLPWADQRG